MHFCDTVFGEPLRRHIFHFITSVFLSMTISLIVNIAFLVTLLGAWCLMLRHDVLMLQQNDFNTQSFYTDIRTSDETYTTQRVALIAIFLASTTTYATQSWMVVLLLCLATLAIALYQFFQRRKHPVDFNKRFGINYFTTLPLPILTAVVVSFWCHSTEDVVWCAILVFLFFTTFSYAITLCANWVISLFGKKY